MAMAKMKVGCGHASCMKTGKGCSTGKGQARKSKDETVAEEKAESPAKEAAEKRAGKGQGKNWIKGAIGKPGALHKQMGVPQGKKIPSGKLKAAASKGGTLGKRARLAETLKGFGKGQAKKKIGKGGDAFGGSSSDNPNRDDYANDVTSADSLTMSNKVASRQPGQLPHQAPPFYGGTPENERDQVGGGQARKKKLGKGQAKKPGETLAGSHRGLNLPQSTQQYGKKIGKGQGPVQPPGGSMPPRGISGSMPLPGLRPKAHHPHRPAGMQPPGGGMKPMGAMGPPPGGLGMPPGGPGMPPGGPGLPPMGGGGPSGPPILPGAGVGGTPGMPPPRPMMGGGQARKTAAKKSAAKPAAKPAKGKK